HLDRHVDRHRAAHHHHNRAHFRRDLHHEQLLADARGDGLGQRRRDPGDVGEQPGRQRDGDRDDGLDGQRDRPPGRDQHADGPSPGRRRQYHGDHLDRHVHGHRAAYHHYHRAHYGRELHHARLLAVAR